MFFNKKNGRPNGKDGPAPEYQGPFIPWGGELHPDRLGPHFAVIGQNGSGKTLTIRMLFQAALAPGGDLRHRVFAYDPKLDFFPILRGIGIPADRIHILNPFDCRSEAWSLAEDIKTSAAARELAAHLLPQEKGEHPYFANTPRALLSELIATLREKAGTRWTLNDLIQLVMTWKFIDVLERAGPRARAAVRGHIKENAESTAANIVSTLQTGLVKYETVGALWHRSAKRPFSIERWMDPSEPPSVLLLGTYPEASESLNHINRAIFQRCAQLLRMKFEDPPDKTWFVLDELRIAQELTALPELLLAARSKGGRFVLGFQDVHGLHDVYGPAKASELLAQCHNIGVFRLSSPESIEWASKYFGTDHWWVPSYGDSSTTSGGGTNRSFTLQERHNILGSRFRQLRLPSPTFGIEGIFATPFGPPWHGHLTPPVIARYLAPLAEEPGLERRRPQDQEPAPFTPGLGKALGVQLSEEDESDDDRGGFLPSLPT